MKIAVVGSGALGLYYGAMLQRAGHDVQFLLRRDFDIICKKGLKVTSPLGDFHLNSVCGFQKTAEMAPVDLVLVGLKTFANQHLAELVKPLMTGQAMVLTLQNGLGNEELLAEAFGADRVLGGVAFLCSNRGEPGTVHHLDLGRIRLGELRAGLSQRSSALAEMFTKAGIPCEAVADLARARWEKLVWNIPFNGLCTLTGQPTDRLMACGATRQLLQEMMSEVVDAGNRQELTEPIARKEFINRMLAMTDEMGPYRPSMMIDHQEGRPLELQAIYGVPLARARAARMTMPRVEMLYQLLQLAEGV